MSSSRILAVTVAVASLLLMPTSAFAAKALKKKPAHTPTKVEPAPSPVQTSPVVSPAPSPEPTVRTPLPGEPAPNGASESISPYGGDSASASDSAAPDEDNTSNFQGLFLKIGLGYGTVKGTDGPIIPEVTCINCANVPTLATLRGSPERYNVAVTTNKGTGLAAGLEFGYNILGYASVALDLAWQGSPFGAATDNAGVGLGGGTVGFHPLRFVQNGKFPLDLRLYGGLAYGISYYHENAMQFEAQGKSWTGSAPLWGIAGEYMFKRKGVFALGFDVRNVMPGYTKWYYNYSNDQVSHLDQAQSTNNWVFKLMFCFHFSGV